jgi:hypothetical protein
MTDNLKMFRPIKRAARNIDRTRKEYPCSIWTMTGGTFINSFGGSMVFPIFTFAFGFRAYGPRLKLRMAVSEV